MRCGKELAHYENSTQMFTIMIFFNSTAFFPAQSLIIWTIVAALQLIFLSTGSCLILFKQHTPHSYWINLQRHHLASYHFTHQKSSIPPQNPPYYLQDSKNPHINTGQSQSGYNLSSTLSFHYSSNSPYPVKIVGMKSPLTQNLLPWWTLSWWLQLIKCLPVHVPMISVSLIIELIIVFHVL